MKKFHVAKIRSLNTEVERDLRGLGDEEFFKHFWPRIVLTQVTLDKGLDIEKEIKRFKLEMTKSKIAENTHHITVPRISNDEFKTDSIKLFSLALYLAKQKNVNARYTLWQ